jgi:hypothetical protein
MADDTAPISLARALNRPTAADIGRIKAGSANAAHLYTAEDSPEKARELVTSLLKEF